MTNLPETKIPYSKEAVEDLVALEREHGENFREKCYICPGTGYLGNHERRVHACPILVTARSSASKKTLVAVALILGGERR